MKMIFESKEPITLTSEDSGCALLVDDGEPVDISEADEDSGMWIRIGSWDADGWVYPQPEKCHAGIRKLEGKRVRITLDVID